MPVLGDIRDAPLLADAVKQASAVFHMTAQVAVTTSLDDPRGDFEVNAIGTLNLLEAVRRRSDPTPGFFASTNQGSGHIDDVAGRKHHVEGRIGSGGGRLGGW